MRVLVFLQFVWIAGSVSVSQAADIYPDGAPGGLSIQGTQQVAMLRADVRLTPTGYESIYRVQNHSDEMVTGRLGFVTPPVRVAAVFDTRFAFHPGIPGTTNYLEYRARVEDTFVALQHEVKAVLVDRDGSRTDVSTTLVANGIPLSLDRERVAQAVEAMGMLARRTLFSNGFLERNEQGWVPLWSLVTEYSWQQKFPPNVALEIGHSFKPVNENHFYAFSEEIQSRYCMDAEDIAYAELLSSEALVRQNRPLMAHRLRYDLRPEASWKGAIRQFLLRIDPKDKTAAVMTCVKGLKLDPFSADGNIYVGVYENFVPPREIDVLLLY